VKIVYTLIKTSWKKLTFSILLSVAAGILYALAIRLLHQIITQEDGMGSGFYQLLACILVSTCLSVYAGHYLTRIYENQVSDLRLSLSDKVLKSDFFHVEKNSLKILPILNNDINTIGSFIKTVPDFMVSISKIIACLVYMFWLSWQLTSYVLGIYFLVFLVTLFIFPQLHKQEVIIRDLKNDLFEQINGLVRGLKELTLNKKHKAMYVDEMMGPVSRRHADSLTIVGTLNILASKVGEMIVVIALSFLLISFNHSNIFEGGVLLEFLTVVLFLLPSLIIVTTFLNSVKKVEVALKQIDELKLEYSPAQGELAVDFAMRVSSSEPLITLTGVEFRYGSDQAENGRKIGPFSFSIRKGEVIYLSGGNGSGKTTLGKLIVGLYSPTGGEICYGVQKITTDVLNEYRDRFSALFPDSHVFRSLAYIDEGVLQTKGQQLIEMLKIEHIVSIHDKALSTIQLSSGQQGRLSLLRSLLENKEIYLFDEWAANQDPLFKLKFYSEIVPMLRKEGKTTIVITHDESYFHLADRIVKLEDGMVSQIVG